MQDLRIEGVDALRIEGVDALWAGWCHEGGAAELVRALKYGRVTAAVTPIADRMASVMPAALAADLVTWVPCSPTRRRERGFDPAELLARALARRRGGGCGCGGHSGARGAPARWRGSQSRYLYHEGASKLSKDVGRGYLHQQPPHSDNAGP